MRSPAHTPLEPYIRQLASNPYHQLLGNALSGTHPPRTLYQTTNFKPLSSAARQRALRHTHPPNLTAPTFQTLNIIIDPKTSAAGQRALRHAARCAGHWRRRRPAAPGVAVGKCSVGPRPRRVRPLLHILILPARKKKWRASCACLRSRENRPQLSI